MRVREAGRTLPGATGDSGTNAWSRAMCHVLRRSARCWWTYTENKTARSGRRFRSMERVAIGRGARARAAVERSRGGSSARSSAGRAPPAERGVNLITHRRQGKLCRARTRDHHHVVPARKGLKARAEHLAQEPSHAVSADGVGDLAAGDEPETRGFGVAARIHQHDEMGRVTFASPGLDRQKVRSAKNPAAFGKALSHCTPPSRRN